MAPNNLLKKLRSRYILSQIFDNVNQITKLKLINYNNYLLKSLNIKLKDYKKAYSVIEIEIIPSDNIYGDFIRIYNPKAKNNYRIYFDDKKLENIRTEITEEDKVKKIRVVINNKIKSFYQLFLNCKCIHKIKFTKFNRNLL